MCFLLGGWVILCLRFPSASEEAWGPEAEGLLCVASVGRMPRPVEAMGI